jgi:hypothetical protein
MINPTRGRILAKMLPAVDDIPNSLGLTLVDKKRHYDHKSRRVVVQAVGRGVYAVKAGDIVIIRGDSGFTLDGDPEVQRPEYGEEFRWLKESDCLAIEEFQSPPPQPQSVTEGEIAREPLAA